MKPIFPIYEFLITDEDENDMSGVNTFSLVSKPAMKTDFIKFSEIPMQKYIFIEKDKKQYKGIVAGIAMKPNELIPRITDSGEKFLGYFSPETIEKIRTKFHRNPENQKAVNLEHNHNNFVNAFLIESYILDSQEMVNAVKAKGIKDATIGSWYTAFKIEDKEVFERCLKGEFNGFSVEAFLNAELTKNNFSTLNIKKMKKNIIQNVKEKLNAILEEMSFKEALVPELNIKVSWGSVGDEVTKTYQDTEGNEKTEPVGQGEFVIEDGRTLIVDENSTLVEIRDKVEEKPEEMVEEEKPVEEKKEEEMPEEEKKEEEEEKPVEDMPVSGDTKQKKTKEEICAECPDCPECLEEEEMAKEEMPKDEKKEEEAPVEEKPVEEMPVSGETKQEDGKVEEVEFKKEKKPLGELPKELELDKKYKLSEEEFLEKEEFAPDGNTNACQHGGRSTSASGYCNGMGSPEKSTGTYKSTKKSEDKKDEVDEARYKKDKEDYDKKHEEWWNNKPKKKRGESIGDYDDRINAWANTEPRKSDYVKEVDRKRSIEKDAADKAESERRIAEYKKKNDEERKTKGYKPQSELTEAEKRRISNIEFEMENSRDNINSIVADAKKLQRSADDAEKAWKDAAGTPNESKMKDRFNDIAEKYNKKYDEWEAEKKKYNDLLEESEKIQKGEIKLSEVEEEKFADILKQKEVDFSALQENFAALQTENEALKAEVAALKVKLSEPIAEPKLKDEESKPVDFSKLSNYEKAAMRKGLPIL